MESVEAVCICRPVNNDVTEWTWIVIALPPQEHHLLLSSKECLKPLSISHLVELEASV